MAEKSNGLIRRLTALTAILTLATALVGAGYSFRKVDELAPRVAALEQGFGDLRSIERDLQWIKARLAEAAKRQDITNDKLEVLLERIAKLEAR